MSPDFSISNKFDVSFIILKFWYFLLSALPRALYKAPYNWWISVSIRKRRRRQRNRKGLFVVPVVVTVGSMLVFFSFHDYKAPYFSAFTLCSKQKIIRYLYHRSLSAINKFDRWKVFRHIKQTWKIDKVFKKTYLPVVQNRKACTQIDKDIYLTRTVEKPSGNIT